MLLLKQGLAVQKRLQFDLPGGVDGLWEEEPEEEVESFYNATPRMDATVIPSLSKFVGVRSLPFGPRICLGATVIPSLSKVVSSQCDCLCS